MLPPIANAGNNLLQPVSANHKNSTQQSTLTATGCGDNSTTMSNSSVQVGSTWSDNLKAGDLKIDLNNLLSSKANKSNAPALSMNALKVQNPNNNMPQMMNSMSPQMPPPLAIQTTTPTMGNFAAFGAQTTNPGLSPGLMVGSGVGVFNKTSPNIPPSSTQFANFNQMNNLMQPATQPQKGFISNNNISNNNNNNMQSFDFFQ
uniref:Uncharacterized protein n=1 Tax=Stomoxys calcitrans TaxID=35570 RepID=A0A1I8PSX1_STOCA